MERVGKRIVDHVKVGVAQQVGVTRVHSRDAIGLREFIRTRPIARRDRDHLGIGHLLRWLDQRVGRDKRRAQNAESNWTAESQRNFVCHNFLRLT